MVLECMLEEVVGHHQDMLEETFESCSCASLLEVHSGDRVKRVNET